MGLIKRILVVGVVALASGCGVKEGGIKDKGTWEPRSSYEIPPHGLDPEQGYDRDVIMCLETCQQNEAIQSDDGEDELRKCGCSCLKGKSLWYTKFCGDSMHGLFQKSDEDTLTDLRPKGENL